MSGIVLVNYAYVCVSEGNVTIHEWREEEEDAPVTCKNDSSHTIIAESVRVISKRDPNTFSLIEESVPTGGNPQSSSIKVDALKNTTSVAVKSWPYSTSVQAINFTTTSEHKGDMVNMTIGENTVIGALTNNISPAQGWVSQNYVFGDIVTYDTGDPDFGVRVYTCVNDTVSNEVPTNEGHWRHGFQISVSQTVVDNTYAGYYITLDDGVNAEDVGRVLYNDKTNSRIYVENNLVNSFSPGAFVKQTVYVLRDYEIGEPGKRTVGGYNLGSSHIPKDTKVRVYYENKSPTVDKEIIGYAEYYY